MEEIKVSVVIPVYNAETYLRQCLDSVTAQSLQEIEIICVDDGSTDRSWQILEEYAAADDRISIYRQENQHAGVARNTGMQYAKGKYIIFWDADDYFHTDALRSLYEKAQEEQAQICICGGYRVDAETGMESPVFNYLKFGRLPAKRPFSRRDIPTHIYNFCGNVPWNKLFLRSFIEDHHLRFQSLLKANDVYFVMLALFYADRISVVERRFIFYRFFNQSSLSGKNSMETCMCTVNAFRSVKEQLEKEPGWTPEIRQSFANKAIGSLLYNLEIQQDYETYCEIFKLYQDEVLDEFGLKGRDRDFFNTDLDYEAVNRIADQTPGELLLYLNLVRLRKVTALNGDKRYKERQIAKLEKRIDELENSTSYRVGLKVTALGRRVKEARKKK